jgi:hypothetical protein
MSGAALSKAGGIAMSLGIGSLTRKFVTADELKALVSIQAPASCGIEFRLRDTDFSSAVGAIEVERKLEWNDIGCQGPLATTPFVPKRTT